MAGGQVLDWWSERELRVEYNRLVARARQHGGPKPGYELADARVLFAAADGSRHSIEIEVDGQYYGQMLRRKATAFGRSGRPS